MICVSLDAQNRDIDINSDVSVYRMKSAWYNRFLNKSQGSFLGFVDKIIRIFRNFINIFIYPNVAPIKSIEVTKILQKIIKENSIDFVVGTFRPYECIKPLLSICAKDSFRSVVFVSYHLDSLLSPNRKESFIKKYIIRKGEKALNREIESFDKVLLPETAPFRKNVSNVDYVGFPLFIKKEVIECELQFDSSFYNITYIGSLDENNRDIMYFIKVISLANQCLKKKIRLHIWGRVSPKEVEGLSHSDYVEYHGSIDNQYVSYIYSLSDALLNVSNQITYNMVPSKIFQLFSSEKPIIDIVKTRKDITIPYFMQYPSVLFIYEYNANSEYDAKMLLDYIEKIGKEEIRLNRDSYKTSEPMYLCECILNTKKRL